MSRHRILDHLLLIQRDSIEVARLQTTLRRLASNPKRVIELSVEHEHDGSCCDREPWRETLSALLPQGEPAS